MSAKGPEGEGGFVHTITLPNDHGEDISVRGRLIAEDMHFNNMNGMLTVEKVYAAEDGARAYGVISAVGDDRERRAYILRQRGEKVAVFNGDLHLDLDIDQLISLLSLAIESEREAKSDPVCEHIRRKLAVND